MRNAMFLGVLCAVAATPAFARDLPPGVPPSAILPWRGEPTSVVEPPSMPAPAQTSTVAPGSLIDSEGGDAIPALPIEPKMAGTVQYLSGGVGEEELAELKAEKNKYNVHVLMNAKDGAYVSDVMVIVHDGKGTEAFRVGDVGPYLYFSLPAGKYTLVATAQSGQRQTVHVVVPGKGSAYAHIVF